MTIGHEPQTSRSRPHSVHVNVVARAVKLPETTTFIRLDVGSTYRLRPVLTRLMLGCHRTLTSQLRRRASSLGYFSRAFETVHRGLLEFTSLLGTFGGKLGVSGQEYFAFIILQTSCKLYEPLLIHFTGHVNLSMPSDPLLYFQPEAHVLEQVIVKPSKGLQGRGIHLATRCSIKSSFPVCTFCVCVCIYIYE